MNYRWLRTTVVIVRDSHRAVFLWTETRSVRTTFRVLYSLFHGKKFRGQLDNIWIFYRYRQHVLTLLKVLFVRKVDLWASYSNHQIMTLLDGGRPSYNPKALFIWWVGQRFLQIAFLSQKLCSGYTFKQFTSNLLWLVPLSMLSNGLTLVGFWKR